MHGQYMLLAIILVKELTEVYLPFSSFLLHKGRKGKALGFHMPTEGRLWEAENSALYLHAVVEDSYTPEEMVAFSLIVSDSSKNFPCEALLQSHCCSPSSPGSFAGRGEK